MRTKEVRYGYGTDVMFDFTNYLQGTCGSSRITYVCAKLLVGRSELNHGYNK